MTQKYEIYDANPGWCARRSPLSFDRIKYLYRRTYCGVMKFEILPSFLWLPSTVGLGYLLLARRSRLRSTLHGKRTRVPTWQKFRVFRVLWILFEKHLHRSTKVGRPIALSRFFISNIRVTEIQI